MPLNGGFLPIFDGIDQIEFLLEAGETDTKKAMEGYLESLKPNVESSKAENHPNV